MGLNIALDFDGTYTADPFLWEGFIQLAQKKGYNVYVVTSRSPDLDRDLRLDNLYKYYAAPIFYTNYTAKKPYMEALGINIDIWIDDLPHTIERDITYTPEQLEFWRKRDIDAGLNPNI